MAGRPSKPTPDAVNHRETSKHRDAFEAWYEADRNIHKVTETYSISEKTAYNWADWFGWVAKADARDAAVERRNAKAAIQRKAAMTERHRKAAELVHKRGAEYFARHAITDERAALQAVKIGSEMERTAEGLPAWMVAMMGMSDDELANYIAAATGAVTAGDGVAAGEGAGSSGPDAEPRDAADAGD